MLFLSSFYRWGSWCSEGIVLVQGHIDLVVHLLCLLPDGELLGHTLQEGVGLRERGSRRQGMPTLLLKSQNAFTQCLTLQSHAGQVLWHFTGGPDPCRWRHWRSFQEGGSSELGLKGWKVQINHKPKQEEGRNNDPVRQVGVSVEDRERRPWTRGLHWVVGERVLVRESGLWIMEGSQCQVKGIGFILETWVPKVSLKLWPWGDPQRKEWNSIPCIHPFLEGGV